MLFFLFFLSEILEHSGFCDVFHVFRGAR